VAAGDSGCEAYIPVSASMQLIISAVTPFDWAMQVEYSCVISLSAAATGGLLKKSAKPITTTALMHNRPFPTLLQFDTEIIL
jgi:hypothetical protein